MEAEPGFETSSRDWNVTNIGIVGNAVTGRNFIIHLKKNGKTGCWSVNLSRQVFQNVATRNLYAEDHTQPGVVTTPFGDIATTRVTAGSLRNPQQAVDFANGRRLEFVCQSQDPTHEN